MAERIEAPWTPEQVVALNAFQLGPFHPFTCGDRNDGTHPYGPTGDYGVLRATPDGWVCDHCPYTQSWAWAEMLEATDG